MTGKQIVESHLQRAVFMEHLTKKQQAEVHIVIYDILFDIIEDLQGRLKS